jgi:trehalose 6-phosphate phosphatase
MTIPPQPLWLNAQLERFFRTAPRLFLCLDYDGTLVPIAPRPEEARPTAALLTLLSQFVHHPHMKVAVVSGRSLADLRALLPVDGMAYIGTHGGEMCTAAGETRRLMLGGVVAMAIARLRQDIAPAFLQTPGFFLEDKHYALALHYRLAQPEDEEWAIRQFLVAVQEYQRKGIPLEIIHGKKVVEVRPVGVNKGRAVQSLLEAEHRTTLPIYIGDDLTDEEAFQSLNGRGLTILVTDLPQPTAARYTLRNPQEVLRFLSFLLDLRS